MIFLIFYPFFCQLVISLAVDDASLFQTNDDLQTPDHLVIANSLDDNINPSYDLFSGSSADLDDDSLILASLSGNNDNIVPLISSDDGPVSSLDLLDLSDVKEEENPELLLSNDLVQSPDLFAPIGLGDSALLLDPSSSVLGSTGLETGDDAQNLALLDDIPAIPLLNPIDFLRGLYDNIQDLNLLEDPPPDKSKAPWIPNCGQDYFPFCCLQGPPTRRYPERGDRRGQCYTYNFNYKVCEDLANHFCCICKDTRRRAYQCWNPHISVPETLGPGFKEKRSPALSIKREESDTITPDDIAVVVPEEEEETNNNGERYQYPGFLNEDSCTDVYLRSIGVSPQKHNYLKT